MALNRGPQGLAPPFHQQRGGRWTQSPGKFFLPRGPPRGCPNQMGPTRGNNFLAGQNMAPVSPCGHPSFAGAFCPVTPKPRPKKGPNAPKRGQGEKYPCQPPPGRKGPGSSKRALPLISADNGPSLGQPFKERAHGRIINQEQKIAVPGPNACCRPPLAEVLPGDQPYPGGTRSHWRGFL